MHVYEVRPRSDKRGFDLISGALPFCRRWYGEPNAISNAVFYAKFFSRSHAFPSPQRCERDTIRNTFRYF
jgi:hypothetical protein